MLRHITPLLRPGLFPGFPSETVQKQDFVSKMGEMICSCHHENLGLESRLKLGNGFEVIVGQ